MTTKGVAMFAVSRDFGVTWTLLTIPEALSVNVYLDSTAPSNFTQFVSYQAFAPPNFTQAFLKVARISK